MRTPAAFQLAQAAPREFVQVLAPLLKNRLWCGWIAGVGIVHLLLAGTSRAGLGCTLWTLSGRPCPGCGLTHAMLDLFRGQWVEALGIHPFAPIFAVLLAIVAAAAVLPAGWRLKMVQEIGRFERRTAIGPLMGVALLGYWFLQLYGVA